MRATRSARGFERRVVVPDFQGADELAVKRKVPYVDNAWFVQAPEDIGLEVFPSRSTCCARRLPWSIAIPS